MEFVPGGGVSGGGSITSPRYAPPLPPPRARSTDFGMSSWPNFLYGESDTSCKSWLTLDIRFQYPREKNDKSGLPGCQLASLQEDWKHIRYLLCL